MPVACSRCSKVAVSLSTVRIVSLSIEPLLCPHLFGAHFRPYRAFLNFQKTPGFANPRRASTAGGCVIMTPSSSSISSA
eukprot:9183726-Lingulodinium_polyedra.AAC.1